MSHALLDFIKAWTSHHSAERILEDGPALPDVHDATTYLNSLSPEDRAHIETELEKALRALDTHLTGLKSEAEDIKRQLNQTNQMSKACLTYSRTPTKPQSG